MYWVEGGHWIGHRIRWREISRELMSFDISAEAQKERKTKDHPRLGLCRERTQRKLTFTVTSASVEPGWKGQPGTTSNAEERGGFRWYQSEILVSLGSNGTDYL
jgi:hypothetical protein